MLIIRYVSITADFLDNARHVPVDVNPHTGKPLKLWDLRFRMLVLSFDLLDSMHVGR